MDIHALFDQFRAKATSEREKGDFFERFIQKYLQTDPQYASLFSDVWLWMDFPYRDGKMDTGIDLVAKEKDSGDFWAIQCKFFAITHSIDKPDIDSFLSASGKKFNADGVEKFYAQRLVVSTTNSWGKNAEDAIRNQQIPVQRLRLWDLANAPIDWSSFSIDKPETMKLSAKKSPRKHQKDAIHDVLAGFKDAERGKLIMACGTGKTYTSLKIAEEMTGGKGTVLFLVPSISLLSQALREWTAQTIAKLHPISVCSDSMVSKSKSEDIGTTDLGFPATTDVEHVVYRFNAYRKEKGLIVLFSTYQSIEVISKAQKSALPEFDLIICDEAHRTTGVTWADTDESAFVKVHYNDFIQAKKRLYMTATPRIYGDESKAKAAESSADICSMDDEALYGKILHQLGFSTAVNEGLLSDYKVMVLAVDEKYVDATFQKQFAKDSELKLEDAVRIFGCWAGLSKRMLSKAEADSMANDLTPMRRAVAFSRRISDSKLITRMFSEMTEAYRIKNPSDDKLVQCEVKHVDGSFNALKRNELLDWLKDTVDEGTCRILSNARCLSEGVDVPALDAVMFLNPRNSIVDVVQSVGRVMRTAPGKKYGYIILPVGIPAGIDPSEALDDNERYKVVWDVLQALRSHDDRFNAIINKIELNKKRPDRIQIIGVGGRTDEGEGGEVKITLTDGVLPGLEDFQHFQDAIYAKLVQKCGSRLYWEAWAKDIAIIAEHHIERINALLSKPGKHKDAFDEFLGGLRKNINDSISQPDAVEMLAQHLITKPVFDALFEGYSFAKNNPVSVSMQSMIDLLEAQYIKEESETLDKFYDSVKQRAADIDNAEGKQKIIIELYDKFFKTAFPKMAERLGIVYTPVEVVDFIINSVEHILEDEFKSSLNEKNVHIIDPFTGTGTFITRLLQSGHIKPNNLSYKYQNELHANEIVLLAYYIASINIEETFHELATKTKEYVPFEGIVLTDTFQLAETTGGLAEVWFPENSKRVSRQKKTPIRVIIGNPPYSIGQGSANDNNANQAYPILEGRIKNTYGKLSGATTTKSLYDSYIKAFRWASDRIGNESNGIVCFVSNGAYIDNNAMSGFRKCIAKEFSEIYCFNLRGNARTSGEQRRREKGNVFESGSRTPIAITLLVKNPSSPKRGVIHYHDIGDYLSREEKLKIIKNFSSVANSKMEWDEITPNASGDWINQRSTEFESFISLGNKDDKNEKTVFAPYYSLGIGTNRDAWSYNYSKATIRHNMQRMIETYNAEMESYVNKYGSLSKKDRPEINSVVETDTGKIAWSSSLVSTFESFYRIKFEPDSIRQSLYRPFCKTFLYYGEKLIHRRGLFPKIYPEQSSDNLVITISGLGATKEISPLITAILPDLNLQTAGTQCFPLYYYDAVNKVEDEQFIPGMEQQGQYIRKDGITDFILKRFRDQYGHKVSKEDIFYYVYGILHSPEYKSRFAADLKKMLPRIPLANNFNAFSNAGRELAKWHLNYESVKPYPLKETATKQDFRVEQMRFAKNGKVEDKTTIIFNAFVTLSEIPIEAYEYVVNGSSAIEWVMERYAVTVNKDSGIKNDPNDWSEDHRYIIDLVKRIVTVSIETMKIVKKLPALEEAK